MTKIIELDQYPPIENIYTYFNKDENSVFLDSSLKNELGRYSIIGLNPYLKLVQKYDGFYVNDELKKNTLIDFLSQYLKDNKEDNKTDIPLISGAIAYFSYDYGMDIMGIKSRHKDQLEIDKARVYFYDNFLIEDLYKKKLYIISNGKLEEKEKSSNKLLQIIEIANSKKNEAKNKDKSEIIKEQNENYSLSSNFCKKDYKEAIDKMIHYIIEGDIYIVNMTRQICIECGIDPYEFFTILRKNNPSPFGAYMNYDGFKIISASPERFLLNKNGNLLTRPIKGTRKRGEDPYEDQLLKEELKNSDKDKSELLMIVDLERNDLNKICTPGSVIVEDLFDVETYATVFHLVAQIKGKLKDEYNFADILKASFPGGSITGSPKYRAMELSDQVEASRRNIYTGSIGYISLNGDCDLNIVIRTALYKDRKYHIGVGGGITCESNLEFEYEETEQKAKALLNALNCVKRGGQCG
ncbi:aminodeoxychorismate synthase component I [Peptostreptococcus equinus]